MAKDQHSSFKGRHFTSEVILWALRWYLAFSISYRDLAAMLSDRASQSITPRCSVGFRPMPPCWNSGSADICGHAPGPGGWTRPKQRFVGWPREGACVLN